MPQIDLTVNGRSYAIACNAGEEERLLRLAQHVDAKTREILKSATQPGETRLVLMAALLIADEYFDSKASFEQQAQEIAQLRQEREDALSRASASERDAAGAVEGAAGRVGEVAERVTGA